MMRKENKSATEPRRREQALCVTTFSAAIKHNRKLRFDSSGSSNLACLISLLLFFFLVFFTLQFERFLMLFSFAARCKHQNLNRPNHSTVCVFVWSFKVADVDFMLIHAIIERFASIDLIRSRAGERKREGRKRKKKRYLIWISNVLLAIEQKPHFVRSIFLALTEINHLKTHKCICCEAEKKNHHHQTTTMFSTQCDDKNKPIYSSENE